MQLTEYKTKNSVYWIDLYGNAYKKCTKCQKVKGEFNMCYSKSESFGFAAFCKECRKEKDKLRAQNPIEKEKALLRVKKHYRTKNPNIKTYNYNSAPKANIVLCKCEITGKEFYYKKTKQLPIVHNNCNIKGDYSKPELLAKALKKHGRFHVCSYCSKSFDLILKGLIQSITNGNNKVLFNPYCSVQCRINYSKQTLSESNRRRRARKRIGYVEVIRPELIYKRDKFKCWICNDKVIIINTKDNNNEPKAATLDHVIPLAKGGTHSIDNIKTCCRQCNSIKSDNIIHGTQLNIFSYASN
jgi:5-methylcytosine-specific restriction endonuclease McrA